MVARPPARRGSAALRPLGLTVTRVARKNASVVELPLTWSPKIGADPRRSRNGPTLAIA
jgi:hypothetical protein